MFNDNCNRKTIQLIKGKESIAEILFTTAIVLELIVMMTDHLASWTLPYRGRVTHAAFVLFCLKILMTKYDLKQTMLIAFAGLLGVVSYCTCKDEYVIRVVAFVAAAIGVNIKKNLRIIFWGTLIGTVIIIALSLTGVCGEVVDVRHYGRGVVEARYCLGFNHANNVHCVLWYIVSVLIILKHDSLKIYQYILLGALNIVVYMLTLSRTGVLAIFIILILSMTNSFYNGHILKYLYSGFAYISLAACIIVSIRAATVIPYYDKYQMGLNRLLTGRLEMIWEYMPMSSWEIFPGSRLSEYVDNGFVFLAYIYGIIVAIVFCAMIIFEIYRSCVNNKVYSLIVIISSIFVVFMEATFIFNISILCNMILIAYWETNNSE